MERQFGEMMFRYLFWVYISKHLFVAVHIFLLVLL